MLPNIVCRIFKHEVSKIDLTENGPEALNCMPLHCDRVQEKYVILKLYSNGKVFSLALQKYDEYCIKILKTLQLSILPLLTSNLKKNENI